MHSSQLQEFQSNPKYQSSQELLNSILNLCLKNWDIDYPAVKEAADLMVIAHFEQNDRPDG